MVANIVILLLISVVVVSVYLGVKTLFCNASVSTRTHKKPAAKIAKRTTAYHG